MLKNVKFIGFIVVFFLIWLYGLHISLTNFVYDSAQYWELGKQFTTKGEFSWLTYNEPLRGYILPFFSFICITIAKFIGIEEMSFFRFASALVYSFFLTILIPSLYEKMTNQKLKPFPIFGFFILIFYFWRGFFLYPLSDFISFFLIIIAIYNLVSYFLKRNFLHILSAGFFIALSTSARPSYQIILLPIFILFVVHSYMKLDYKKYIPHSLIIMILGMSIAYSPQLFINAKKYNVISPFIQTGIAMKGNLFVQQLFWGIYLQRYETNINTDTYPSASVYFYDKQGISILDKEHMMNSKISGVNLLENYTLNDYLKILIKYPLDMLVIYIKHIFNGMDLMYHSGYLDEVYNNRILFSLFNYTMWFISFISIFRILRTGTFLKEKYFELSIITIVILPTILSIPSAIETRFFLPFYILNYIVISFYMLNRRLKWGEIKSTTHKYALPYIIFILICFTFSAITFSNISDGHYLLNN
ncbi:MAG: hypothetical protein JWM44_1258 [Bacilli bacterium]|nr:hypothetical protein [Bacilli bacterium]